MATTTLKYTQYDNNVSTNLNELGLVESSELVNQIEEQIALLQGAGSAIAVKSFRSARFTLLNKLAQKKNLRVLSYEPETSWANDLNVYARTKISIVYASQFNELSLAEIIRNEKIDVVYLSSISSSSLEVENHSFVIAHAHANKATVVYDNSTGLGTFYNPLVNAADYTLIDVTDSDFAGTGIGAFIAEGAQRKLPHNTAVRFFEETPLQELKAKRTWLPKQKFLYSSTELTIADRLNKELEKFRAYAANAFKLAKWLNQEQLVAEVNYPGLKSSRSFAYSDAQLSGFGYELKFKLWDGDFGHNLLRSYLVVGRPAGVSFAVDNDLKEFTITIKSESGKAVIQYFQKIFAILNKELEYRYILKKQLKLQEALKDFLNA